MKRIFSIIIALALALMYIPAFGEGETEITVPDRVVSGKAEACASEITLSGSQASVYGGGASLSGGVLTINQSGSYLITGEFDGTIAVDVSKEKKVELCLNGAWIKGGINVISAPKNVTIVACECSVNIVSESSAADETTTKAAIYSKEDLKFKGTGALYVVSDNNRGIHSSDDIEISEISLYVISGGNGIHGKDSVTIESGSVYIKTGEDGIKTTNSEDEGKGFVLISGGTVTIIAAEDGIQASNYISVTGGDLNITAGGGYTASTKAHTDDFGFGGSRGGQQGGGKGGWGNQGGKSSGQSSSAAAATNEVSKKGIKAVNEITIDGGTVVIDSADDAIHSDKNTTVNGGTITVSAGDDGVHAGSILTITGGKTTVTTSYEGFEGTVVNISGGENRVRSSDDGINAAGDDSTVTTSAGRGGFGGNGLGELNISGGYTVINADGDGVDSNNILTISGGVLIVYGPVENMNGALDYENSCTYTGGTVLAVGSSGMAQSVTAEGTGAVLAFRVSMPADTLLSIKDAEGNDIIAFSAPKTYSSVVYASDLLTKGEKYTVSYYGENNGIVMDYIYSGANTTGASQLGTITAK